MAIADRFFVRLREDVVMFYQPRSKKTELHTKNPLPASHPFALEGLEDRVLFSAPSIPAGLRVTGSTTSSISLRWTASADDGEVTGYRVYRNGVKLRATPTGTTFTDQGLAAGTSYTYSIRAADDSGLFSRYALAVEGTTNPSTASSGFDVFSASHFDASSGVLIGNRQIDSLDDGDWAAYTDVRFTAGAQSIRFNLAQDLDHRGGTIEIRLDSPDGSLVGTHEIQPTGGTDTFITQFANVSTITGTHDVYLVFRGGNDMGRLRSFAFSDAHLTRIMAMGDSITHAFDNTPSYRWYLWHDLLAGGFDVDFVGSQNMAINGDPPRLDFDQDHEGHTGWRADDLANNARAWTEEFQPEVVLLHAGSNDIEQGQSTDSTIDDLADTIREVRAVNPDVTILLAKILPFTGHDQAVDDLNSRIPGLASSLNTSRSRVIVVDMNTGFSAADLQDGSHLTSDGESKFANKWFATLKNVLE